MSKNSYFAIFGGGGIRGLAYCGACKALQEAQVSLTGCAGSSIGAVFASMLALGYSHDEIFEELSSTGFGLFIDFNIDFKKEIAFSKGNLFLDWIREKIEAKFYGEKYIKGAMPPVKFEDIDYKLIIFSVNLTDLKFHEFSKEKTPDFEIAQAVRASVSMPGLFVPFEYKNKLLVDGDLLKPTPLWRVCESIKNSKERILEFRLEDNETSKKVSNSIEYLNRVYNAICGFATDYIIDLYKEKDKFDYIKINTVDVSVVDFLISMEKKKELYAIGYNSAKNYFGEFFPKKRKDLCVKYEKLLSYLLKIQKEFLKENSLSAYLALCEVFMFLCDEKRYLDVELFNSIVDFKNLFKENYTSFNFFGFRKARIGNLNLLSEKLLEIIKSATLKINELCD